MLLQKYYWHRQLLWQRQRETSSSRQEEVARNVPSFLHLGPATGRAAPLGRLGLRLWLWCPSAAFWHMRWNGKQNLNLALKEAFHLFTLSVPQLPVSHFLGLFFFFSVSVLFLLASPWAFTALPWLSLQLVGLKETQLPKAPYTDSSLNFNHCAYTLPTVACTGKSLALPSKLLLPGRPWWRAEHRKWEQARDTASQVIPVALQCYHSWWACHVSIVGHLCLSGHSPLPSFTAQYSIKCFGNCPSVWKWAFLYSDPNFKIIGGGIRNTNNKVNSTFSLINLRYNHSNAD